jgi:hypothetical protein
MGNCGSCDCDGNGDKKVEFTISKVIILVLRLDYSSRMLPTTLAEALVTDSIMMSKKQIS